MKLSIRKISTLLAFALAVASRAHAEDIDLFVGSEPMESELPRVLFIIDNTANWNSAFAAEMNALASVFERLPHDRIKIGIMLATETGGQNNSISGGYVRAAFRTIDSSTETPYVDLIRSFDRITDRGNAGMAALQMAEAYRYFTGGEVYAGNYKIKADYASNRFGTTASRAIYDLGENALGAIGDTSYNLPNNENSASCTKNFIIYISNGPNQVSDSLAEVANRFLRDARGDATQIQISPTGSQSDPSDEWARFMRTQNIITYTIDVNKSLSGQGPGWTALLKSMARIDPSEGPQPARYFDVSTANGSAQLELALGSIFSDIQDVNSVFASVSLPLSVNQQGTYLNQVYVGLFRPNAAALPRWAGNLKQYRLDLVDDTDNLRLHDAADQPAINATTGFLKGCARSYWSPLAANTYWSFLPQGSCVPTGFLEPQFLTSDSPDGAIVEKGGAGYRARNVDNLNGGVRTMKTCSTTFNDCTTLTDFTTGNSNISAEALGATTTTERAQLINWARGLDVFNEDGDANVDSNNDGVTEDIRPSVHGDVVHSRPVAINFGTDSNKKVLVFYGGNDGVFRAINGNRGPDSSGVFGNAQPGEEVWSFMPPEFFGHIKRIRENTVRVNFPTITDPAASPKPYGIDGPITGHRTGTNSAWIYASMRRGGRALYAFNVEVGTTTNITLKWKKGCPGGYQQDGTPESTTCYDTELADLGQTWSQPKVVQAPGYAAAPLLIMGGGYDPCEDREPNTCSSSSTGKKIYVLNADTGAVVRTFDTARPVSAELMIVPHPTTGAPLYAYAADLGGNIYRIDIGTQAPTDWDITPIARLGCDSTATCSRNRKFMFAPDVLLDNGTYVLLIGSGDREKPRNVTNSVQNYFFMLKDRPQDPEWLSSDASCGDALCLDSLLRISGSSNPSAEQLAETKGWYLALESTEQVVTSALTIFGNVTFSTHKPALPQPGQCSSNLGLARVYNIAYWNASATNGADRSEDLPPQVGLPPSPVGGAVLLDNGELVPFCIGCRPESPLEGEQPEPPASSMPSRPKSRVYWYIQR